MEIIIVRHTTPNIEKGVCYGQADIDVTATFSEELQPILKELKSVDFDHIYASPLQRCKKLAEKISPNITFDNRLKELDFGDWELKKWDDIPAEEINPWMENFVEIPVTNGESYVDLNNRVVDFLQEIEKLNTQHIVIVTHAGVMRCIWACYNNIPLDKTFELKLTYGQILKISTNGKN